jgi:repressor LexA
MSDCCPTCGAKRQTRIFAPSFGVTARMMSALKFIGRFVSENGFSPNFEEIKAGCGLTSKSQVHRLVHSLNDRNLIRSLPQQARSICLTDAGEALTRQKSEAQCAA